MGALLVLAVLAQDPDTEWAGPQTVSPAQIPAAPAARPADPEVDWHSEPATPAEPAERSLFRATLEVAGGFSPSALSAFGAGLEVGWLPLAFLRLDLSFAGAWVPTSVGYQQASTEQRGALRLFAGLDGVLPLSWGELFLGLQSGFTHSNARDNSIYYDFCYEGGCGVSAYWEWQPSLRLRTGFDVLKLRPLTLGVDIAYSLFGRNYQTVHWAELHARIGMAF